MDLERINAQLGDQPEQLVDWALGLGRRAIVTTNFGPFAAVLLHMVTRARPDIPVLMVDTGYGTESTYRYADELSRLLRLDLHTYVPRRTRAMREALEGPAPTPDDPRHAAFTEEVKLEPFRRALAELRPEVWFTALRQDQTEFRAGLKPVTLSREGILKVSPVFHWSSRQMNDYLKAHGLPNNFDYFDPTKAEDKRECGLHVAH
ncbi:MAG TPA: phosphoadenosine phosphosulfate reductase family protein [Nevskia sp.]|nr:phosphoadenosine phosphosulfate reductase family protein [Nevskia sp.]